MSLPIYSRPKEIEVDFRYIQRSDAFVEDRYCQDMSLKPMKASHKYSGLYVTASKLLEKNENKLPSWAFTPSRGGHLEIAMSMNLKYDREYGLRMFSLSVLN